MIDKTAVILAGGKSSRMNFNDKSLLKIRDKRFIEIIIEELKDYKEIIIVSNKKQDYEYLDVTIVEDILPNKGPLSGIHSALKNATYNECLCVACDMPMIKRDLMNYLGNFKGEYDALVPIVNEKLQPLCAIYKKTCLDKIESCLKNDIRKITLLYSSINVHYVNEEELTCCKNVKNQFKNINTPKDYKELLENN